MESSLRELQNLFEDETQPTHDREHAYFRYWVRVLQDHAGQPLRTEELDKILAHSNWLLACGSILSTAARFDMLSKAQIEAILRCGAPSAYAEKELTAILIASDPDRGWQDKLGMVLASGAYWLLPRFLTEIPQDDLPEARAMVERSNRPKGSKHHLLERLSDRDQGR